MLSRIVPRSRTPALASRVTRHASTRSVHAGPVRRVTLLVTPAPQARPSARLVHASTSATSPRSASTRSVGIVLALGSATVVTAGVLHAFQLPSDAHAAAPIDDSPAPDLELQDRLRRSRLLVDLTDTEVAFRHKPTWKLLQEYLILYGCTFTTLFNFVSAFWDMPVLSSIVKHTVFTHFVAGEHSEDAVRVYQHLKSVDGPLAMLDHSVEVASGEQAFDATRNNTLDEIRVSHEHCPGAKFTCIKLSSLTDWRVMEKLAAWIRYHEAHPELERPAWLTQVFGERLAYTYDEGFVTSPFLMDTWKQTPEPLTQDDMNSLTRSLKRMHEICEELTRTGMSILVDAEEHEVQVAVEYMAYALMRTFNKERPVVYHTPQMYMRESLGRLKKMVAQARKDDIQLGIKIVRGAYLWRERRRAAHFGYDDPTQPHKTATSRAYNRGVEFCLDNIDQVGLIVASHNMESVALALLGMAERNIPARQKDGYQKVYFGQLYGMADYLSFNLSRAGYASIKLVPFGEIGVVVPYLLRRVEENRDVVDTGAEIDRRMLWQEIKRRSLPW